jgi:hypothetical protein
MKKKSDFSDLKAKLTVETTGEFKNLELTDEQYSRLLTLMKIGLRVVGSTNNNINVPMYDIDQYICSFSKQFNAEHLVELSDIFGIYMCCEAMSLEMEKMNETYGEGYVFSELSHRLALRDLFKSMPLLEETDIQKLLEKIEAEYIEEFEKNGLHNIKINGKTFKRKDFLDWLAENKKSM